MRGHEGKAEPALAGEGGEVLVGMVEELVRRPTVCLLRRNMTNWACRSSPVLLLLGTVLLDS